MAPSPIEHPAEASLFDGILACELVLPAAFTPHAPPPSSAQAEALLLGLAQVEDLRTEEAPDDRGEASQLGQRVNAKLDLMLVLLGRLVRQSLPVLPMSAVRWSARGLRLDLPAPCGAARGTDGVIGLQPSDWLPDALELPASVIAEVALGDGRHALWLRFPALAPGLADALDRHLFRLHRRQVADARRR